MNQKKKTNFFKKLTKKTELDKKSQKMSKSKSPRSNFNNSINNRTILSKNNLNALRKNPQIKKFRNKRMTAKLPSFNINYNYSHSFENCRIKSLDNPNTSYPNINNSKIIPCEFNYENVIVYLNNNNNNKNSEEFSKDSEKRLKMKLKKIKEQKDNKIKTLVTKNKLYNLIQNNSNDYNDNNYCDNSVKLRFQSFISKYNPELELIKNSDKFFENRMKILTEFLDQEKIGLNLLSPEIYSFTKNIFIEYIKKLPDYIYKIYQFLEKTKEEEINQKEIIWKKEKSKFNQKIDLLNFKMENLNLKLQRTEESLK